MTDNVVLFPEEKIVHPEHSAAKGKMIDYGIETIEKHTKALRNKYTAAILESIIPFIFTQLTAMGIPQTGDDIIKAGAFFMESLKALLYYHFGAHHKFHKLIEKHMIIDENGKLTIEGLDDD
jgi:hypothetical protein